MGEFNKCLGVPLIVVTTEDDGTTKEWKVSPPKGRIKAAYESWLESQVRQQVVGQKAFLGTDDYLSLLMRMQEKIALHKYSWGELAWRDSLESADGLCKLFQLLLSEHHPEVRGWDKPQIEALLEKNRDEFTLVLKQVVGGNDSPPKTEPAPTKAPAMTTAAG